MIKKYWTLRFFHILLQSQNTYLKTRTFCLKDQDDLYASIQTNTRNKIEFFGQPERYLYLNNCDIFSKVEFNSYKCDSLFSFISNQIIN